MQKLLNIVMSKCWSNFFNRISNTLEVIQLKIHFEGRDSSKTVENHGESCNLSFVKVWIVNGCALIIRCLGSRSTPTKDKIEG